MPILNRIGIKLKRSILKKEQSLFWRINQFFKLIRWPNLIIIAFTQYLIRLVLVGPYFQIFNTPFQLSGQSFFLLVIATLCIAASGNIINDIFDVQADRINKPEKLFIGKSISFQTAWIAYWLFLVLGFLLTIYLGFEQGKIPYISYFPLAAFLLFAYSKWWKKQTLIGNFVVSAFCAGVAYLVVFSEERGIRILEGKDQEIYEIFTVLTLFYIAFAFFSTLFREIIKDMEDVEGDRMIEANTIPIRWGMASAKMIAWMILWILCMLLIYFFFAFQMNLMQGAMLSVLGFLPVLFAAYSLISAKEKSDYHQISILAKLMIVSGLFLLPIITQL